ncbi:NAD(P)-dependent oxidoreductase [Pandoraea terrae]|uniref:NAD(P)-dependent oxidoreductase n=1 Tax=Pandoraea terrae TaxID=1537710 RepID=A0A5E4R935_9BURK|nr:SDR family NAD(P)-dependent oxidoreductase [Pandoraea terrae]VVD59790.1 NAD(P)-dependent oxidoreductase [Pandoraea terrae]
MKNPSKKFGLPRLLIIGCGDIGMRCLPALRARFRVFALTSSDDRRAALRAAGAVPVTGNLDRPASLARLRGLARHVVHLAPPPSAPGTGPADRRTRLLRSVLARPPRPYIVPERVRAARKHTLVYASTSGVYGDCGGARIDETRTPHPLSPRGARRVDAERAVRSLGRPARQSRRMQPAAGRSRAHWRMPHGANLTDGGWRTSILRIPGIYAADRLPTARLARGTPALRDEDDVYTNHIHADDLAGIVVAALWHGRPQRVVHASDDTEWKMAEYFDRVADALGQSRPPRVSREEAARVLEPALLSFMRESRRLDNGRLKQELRYRLRYPSVQTLLDEIGVSGMR